jgi:predicted dehydrogenase
MVAAAEAPGVVVVGTGFGCLTHVRALRAAGFEVRALVGQDPARTATRAARWEVPVATTSLPEALALDGVAAVTIATPPHTHSSLVHEAVAAGRHVLCEKPFARDTAEARAMLDAAERAGVVHLLGCEFRFAAGQVAMARAVASGLIGEPRLATFLLHVPLLADPDAEVPGWWSSGPQGGGWLGAHASHVVDQVRSTLGEFEALSAGLPSVVGRGWTAEDTYTIHFRLDGGEQGVLQGTASDRGPLVMMNRIVGSAGTVWAEGDRVRVADASGVRELDRPDDVEAGQFEPPPSDLLVTAYDLLHATGIDVGPYTALFRTFRALIEGRPIAEDPRPATFADGVASMAVLDAVRRSASAGSWETVERV